MVAKQRDAPVIGKRYLLTSEGGACTGFCFALLSSPSPSLASAAFAETRSHCTAGILQRIDPFTAGLWAVWLPVRMWSPVLWLYVA